jgi:xylulokinase
MILVGATARVRPYFGQNTMSLLGLDVGTTGCKAVIFDPDGRILGSGFQEYGITCVEPGMAEQDAEHVWQMTRRVLRQALAASGARDVRALSLSVQGDAIIPVDEQFRPVYPAILGMDYRSAPQAAQCADLFGARALFDLTGMRPHPMNSLVKLLWLREQRPDAFAQARKIVTYADFILAKLGAPAVIDETMASRTMAFDLSRRAWSTDLLDRLNLAPELWSDTVPSGTVVGAVSQPASAAAGLPAGALLVAGGHDQTCAALGAGVVRAGIGVISTGTAEVLSTAFTQPALNDAMFQSFYPCYRHAKAGMYFTFALNHVGGLLLRWYRDNFAGIEVQEAAQQGLDPYDQILSKMPVAGPSPVLVLPHLNGSGTPWCDLASKGAIVGLTMATTRHDLARAILESQTYELKINIETLERAGVGIQEFIAVGGGAKSAQWLQIKADILERPVKTLAVREAACLGAAILAGAASGVYASVDEAVSRVVRSQRVFTPQADAQKKYIDMFRVYTQLYPALHAINREL